MTVTHQPSRLVGFRHAIPGVEKLGDDETMSMTRRETTDGWVCEDCLFFLANGDLPEGREDEYLASLPEDIEVTLGRTFEDCAHDYDAWQNGDESHLFECETREFSWSQCDYCRSTLGGSRHAVTFWL